MAMGGILRWKDGRNMPDVQAALYDYHGIPMYMRLNLGTEMPETYRFHPSVFDFIRSINSAFV